MSLRVDNHDSDESDNNGGVADGSAGEPAFESAQTQTSARLGGSTTEQQVAAAMEADGVRIMEKVSKETAPKPPYQPRAYCHCSFRFDEYIASDFDLHASRPDEVCAASSVSGGEACIKGPCGSHPNKRQQDLPGSAYGTRSDAVYRLPQLSIDMGGGGRSHRHAMTVFRGCFETSTAKPDLQHSVGARPSITNGNGFEALQTCARRCQQLHLPYMAMNDGGCWCDDQFGSGGGFERVDNIECAASTAGLKQCGAGPCGARSDRNAIYEVAPSPSGAASTIAPGNFIARVKATISVGFSGEWVLRARSTAFEWMLRVVETSSGRVLAKKETKEPGVAIITVVVELTWGIYDVELFGAFGNRDKMAEGSEAIEFMQKSHCNVTDWTPLTRGSLAECKPDPVGVLLAPPPPPLVVPSGWSESDLSPPEGSAVVTIENHPRKRDTEHNPETNETMMTNPSFDGAFLSMKIGGIDLKDPFGMKDAIADNYVTAQGRFMLLGISLEIDMSIKPGSMEQGGGIRFKFYFNWGIEGAGGYSAIELGGHLDLVPLDIDKLFNFKIKEFIMDLTLSMGVWIKPHIINQV